jgi:hypothetical protein
MFGTEPTATWWRRPVTLAAAAGLVAGVVIGGASHSLPAASTRPMAAPLLVAGAPRATVTVTVAAPTRTVTVLQTATRTITVVVNSTVSTAPVSPPAATVSPLTAPTAAVGAPAGPTASTSLEPPVFGTGPTTVHGRHDVQHRTPPGRLRAS